MITSQKDGSQILEKDTRGEEKIYISKVKRIDHGEVFKVNALSL